MRLLFRIILLAILTTPLFGQSRLTAELASQKIQTSFYSDSSKFHFDINSIDSLTFHRFISYADSIDSSPYDAIFGKDKRQVRKFMANNNEEWRCCDFVTAKNENLPQRKFLFAWTHGEETVMFYWHGGNGRHLHVVLINTTKWAFTAFGTPANVGLINKLDRDHKLQDIRLHNLTKLVNANEVRCLENNLVRKNELDVF